MTDDNINRRDVIALGFGGAVSTVAGCATAGNGKTETPAAERIKLNQGFEDFTQYFRLISDFGGVSTFRYQYGRVLMVPAPRHMAEDFVDFVSIKQDRSRRLPNGNYHHAYKGITMFTDKDTGEVLETFENPYTGESNTVQHFATSGGSIVYTPTGAYTLKPGADPNVTPTVRGGPIKLSTAIAGDYAWLTYPERFEIRDADGKLLGSDNSMYRYHAKLDDLTNPAIANVETVMNWQTETGMWAWMSMPKDFPGHCIFGGLGRKYAALDELPQHYIAAAEAREPGHLSALIDWEDFVMPYATRES